MAYRSLIIHEQLRGKIAIHSKIRVATHDDFLLAYTSGVAKSCEAIATVAVVSDESAVPVLGRRAVAPRVAQAVCHRCELADDEGNVQ